MTCDEWKAFAHDYVFGDLSDPAREQLDRHAASCAACLGEAGLLELVDRRLREEPVLDVPEGLGRRALPEIRPGREMWRVAAALLLAGAIGAMSVTTGLVQRLPDELGVVVDAARVIPRVLSLE